MLIKTASSSGTTTSGYVSALDWDTVLFTKKTILLENTHDTLSLKYKLLGYVGDLDKELVAETTLAASEVAEFHYDRQWRRLVLQVIDGSGHATYTVDYEGQRV